MGRAWCLRPATDGRALSSAPLLARRKVTTGPSKRATRLGAGPRESESRPWNTGPPPRSGRLQTLSPAIEPTRFRCGLKPRGCVPGARCRASDGLGAGRRGASGHVRARRGGPLPVGALRWFGAVRVDSGPKTPSVNESRGIDLFDSPQHLRTICWRLGGLCYRIGVMPGTLSGTGFETDARLPASPGRLLKTSKPCSSERHVAWKARTSRGRF